MPESVPIEGRITRERYFELIEQGVIGPSDPVELLEGLIVISRVSPQRPRHAYTVAALGEALREALRGRAFVREQLPFDAGAHSVPEPDLAVVPGPSSLYRDRHPSEAFLVVEIAEASLAADRLTKSAVYAAASLPEYWIVNLRDDCVEVFRQPLAAERRYAEARVVPRGERLEVMAFPGTMIPVDDVLR